MPGFGLTTHIKVTFDLIDWHTSQPISSNLLSSIEEGTAAVIASVEKAARRAVHRQIFAMCQCQSIIFSVA